MGPGEGKGVTLGKKKVRKEQELERDQERREGREGGMETRPTRNTYTQSLDPPRQN